MMAEGIRVLADRDAELAALAERYPLPPLWLRAPGFPTLLHFILEQQVSLSAARAMFERLKSIAVPLTPETFLALDEDTLRACGFSRQKMKYGRALAQDLSAGTLDLDALVQMDDDLAHDRLVALHGIGKWTANVYLLMALGRRDAWPAGDLGIVVALQRVKRLPTRPSEREAEAIAEPWRPWRAVAARLLWSEYLEWQRTHPPVRTKSAATTSATSVLDTEIPS
ncbi:MAG: DNA-3-methyladenine glycosylase family protein, partial [Caldilineaceae bacterium]